jgi:hypothetical protein
LIYNKDKKKKEVGAILRNKTKKEQFSAYKILG